MSIRPAFSSASIARPVPRAALRARRPRAPASAPRPCLLAALVLCTAPVLAFDSGSTGADGAFAPQVDTRLDLPPDGVFNFTSVNIPAGVTVSFGRNATNTPVVWLVSGNVTIAGSVNLRGGGATHVGAAGDGNIGDDGLPGLGGPGGFDGGRGGRPATQGDRSSGAGLGPGGGGGSATGAGGNGAFADAGHGNTTPTGGGRGAFGTPYGSSLLLPLIGGSGGGGGCGGTQFHGSGGGGGGGAILIAASGTVDITGSIVADGGNNGALSGSGVGCDAGPGAGGGIRVVATTILGNGSVVARGGLSYFRSLSSTYRAGSGRIRFEAENFQRTAASNPAHSFGPPGPLFISGSPTVRITSVGGEPVPDQPTGVGDVHLPEETPNPVLVTFETTGIPVGNVVELKVIPAHGPTLSAVTPALTGSTESAQAEVAVELPQGPSVLSASVTYAVTGGGSVALSEFTGGDPVVRVRLESPMGGPAWGVLITESGAEFPVPPAVLALANDA